MKFVVHLPDQGKVLLSRGQALKKHSQYFIFRYRRKPTLEEMVWMDGDNLDDLLLEAITASNCDPQCWVEVLD